MELAVGVLVVIVVLMIFGLACLEDDLVNLKASNEKLIERFNKLIDIVDDLVDDVDIFQEDNNNLLDFLGLQIIEYPEERVIKSIEDDEDEIKNKKGGKK